MILMYQKENGLGECTRRLCNHVEESYCSSSLHLLLFQIDDFPLLAQSVASSHRFVSDLLCAREPFESPQGC